MRKRRMSFRGLILISAVSAALASAPAFAGKVDEVKKAVKEKCSKDLSDAETMEAVVKAYDCSPGSDVSVAGCTIKCKKGDSGNVVGGGNK